MKSTPPLLSDCLQGVHYEMSVRNTPIDSESAGLCSLTGLNALHDKLHFD